MKRLEVDACIGSELKDTQGETLSVEGADISELASGNGRWNDNHGKGFFNSLGRVTTARKILTEDDITNDRERYYWDQVKSPYIYAAGYLYNDEDHPNAKATAAILRNIHKTDSPLRVKASVEGGVISRGIKDPSYLARTKIHSVALTFTPANNATLVEPLDLKKSGDTARQDELLIKSVIHLAQDNVPSFIDVSNNLRMNKITNNVHKINALVKEQKNYFKGLGTGAINEKKQARLDARAQTKITPATPAINVSNKPEGNIFTNDVNTVKSPQEDVIGHRAKEAMKNPKYINELESKLKNNGVEQHKVNKIISSINNRVDLNTTNPTHHAKRHMNDAGHLKRMVDHMNKQNQPKEAIAAFLNNVKKAGEKLDTAGDEEVVNLNEAMCAGYGGSGSPMQHAGGSVMQSESLSRDFKYITCDDCGKEQVSMKNQVKCRNCGKSFSFKKIFSAMGA